ncbi:SDR family oxidoreductase [Alphaproteobacteria bacterium]|nr:SDR family oxidoreductase [Alphaproteobacteria bacterium]MDA8625663.1 SDR family oxidoreductase [Alphaproteobacteria bacterium]MDA8667312.1 SDR family oxidoreductase [Alphaproteobacteria bacterium]MDA8779943.1 SDR family oxidoreductase [Alphaproteobacteria bacterium]MDA9591401.1 SDR family oxidoreductase [Alphaproteobacteria bacterium]
MAETHHKAVLITGAGKRIGRALAEALATDGWAIAAHYAGSKSEAEALIAEITDKGGKAEALQADLRDAAAVQTLVADAAAALGPLTALINNASTFERDTAHTLTAESWDTHLNANLRAPALLMRDFANQAALQDGSVADACIINITDQRVDRLTPDFTSYTVSKTGLATLTETFAQALAPLHIRVNAIAPGPTLPNPRQAQAEFDKQASLVPLGHGATPDDIVAAARYILTARAMTGQTLMQDGGQHLAWQTPDVVEVRE